ncbi:unnamed protein product [Lymnaea stagnalis]|uniref:Protein rolling stone n=1 Tax=Lymnaea stagnalis TaxID=6523 RepID=A0AAV2H0A1_LYMST
MSTSIREEFRLRKFGLGYCDPDTFVKTQCRLPACVYFLWRLFWFVWHVAWIIGSGINSRLNKARDPDEGPKWFIYLTNTTLLLTTLTCTVDFLIILYLTVRRTASVIDNPTSDLAPRPVKNDEIIFRGEMMLMDGLKEFTTPWYLKLSWFLYNVVGSTNILVTIMYWTVEFNGSTDVVVVVVHTINTVFIISNLLLTAMPWQILHFIYPVLYAALYFLFTYIYYAAGGTDFKGRPYIYSTVDWSKAYPTAVYVSLGVLVAVPIVHIVLFAVYTFRIFLFSKLNSATYSTQVTGASSSAHHQTRVDGARSSFHHETEMTSRSRSDQDEELMTSPIH